MTAQQQLFKLMLLATISALFLDISGTKLLSAAEVVPLTTRDGVQLKISYFPGTARKGSLKAKQTTPVVFLHDYKGSRAVFTSLVQKLQAMEKAEVDRPSFAAVTVDLRAHGESNRVANNPQIELDASKLNKNDYLAMASNDMDAVRSFLVQKNDEGELNLNKLCLVGSGMGANVAAIWALTDWSYPPLAVGKQGQDVKAVVMISPRWSYNGLLMQLPMKSLVLKRRVAWMIVYGDKDSDFKTDATKLDRQLEKYHPATDDTGARRTRGFNLLNLNTRLQGDSLLTQMGESVDDQIVKFLTENVADTQQPWLSRLNRLP